MSVSDFPRRTLRGRILALVGVALIVGVAMLGLCAIGVFDSAKGEAAALVETPKVDGGDGLEVGPLAGQIAPDFEVSDFDGNRHRLSDYRGEVVYINFWATWCVPCQAELPDIYRLHQEYGDDLVVLEINRGEDADKAQTFFENFDLGGGEKGVSFTVDAIDPTEALYKRYLSLPIQVTPISIFVDKRGVVSKLSNGQMNYDDMKAAVEAAMSAG